MDDQRLQRVADELEVRNVIARLAHLADDGDLDEYIQIFTPDAVWEGAAGFAARNGREDILSGARERRESGTSGPGTHTRHVVSTTEVRLDGDQASSQSVFRYYTGSNAKPELLLMGVYQDEFRRTPEGWRLARRRIANP
ncbi:MAG: nuclear transport factor 2 family protein [Proteobacteria bacterium]|nr:nuclear transport factor 2 family protein [Pseudomonadota bacterium]